MTHLMSCLIMHAGTFVVMLKESTFSFISDIYFIFVLSVILS